MTKCFIYVLLLLIYTISCYANDILKEHVVIKENNIKSKFTNIKKAGRDYHEIENKDEKRSYSNYYHNLIFYDDNIEFISSSWNIYAKTRGTKIYTINRNRNSNICNKMRKYYDIPLIIKFAENGLVSFQYKYYLDIEKLDSFLAFINYIHPHFSISVAYLSKKYEYNEIELMEHTITTFKHQETDWKKIKYILKMPQYKHSYKFLLIRNNGPPNTLYIGSSMFLSDDFVFYSDEGGVNTDYIYLTGTDLTNINRNGFFSITSLTSILNFSLVFNEDIEKPISNLDNFDGLSFFLIKSSPAYVNIEFTINTSNGEYSTTHTIAIDKSVVSIMFDFRNFHGYNFLTENTDSISFSFESSDLNCIFRIRQIIGHIKYPEERHFDYVFNRYENKTYEPSYFEVEDTEKYVKNQCLIVTGRDLLENKRNLKKSIIFAGICGALIIFINVIFLFKFKVFQDEPKNHPNY
ncbi:hypothetical protein BCR36DRAFT_409332 [Piromyces finnis]|uniref:Uncharacterized protein n=1 Tax=Piromyces finnis TaxID=1754191 RepID=A0A1Y1VJJ4_9FUNG|nr:hypothetical protein BCR36DRAFT_409332 [Piromyces finnis]|eukprot:ORX57873.1 hypothetical protein BCR36DRAFT_409332 [Piromyces finnis]